MRRIEEASKAFMEGRISRSVYAFLVEFYQKKLVEAERLKWHNSIPAKKAIRIKANKDFWNLL